MTIGRKTGGRTKGTPNRKTQALQAKVEAAGRVSPLDFVLGVMWDPDALRRSTEVGMVTVDDAGTARALAVVFARLRQRYSPADFV
jgi:hypothetical protein